MHRCHSPAEHFLSATDNGFLQLLSGRFRISLFFEPFQSCLPDHAVWLSVRSFVKLSAGKIRFPCHLCVSQSHGIGDSHMAAGADNQDQMLAGYVVQILFGWKRAVWKQVLVPSPAEYPFSRRDLLFFNKVFDPPAHLLAGTAVFQIYISQGIAIAHQMGMGVVKAWNDGASPQIDNLGMLSLPCFHLLIGADLCDFIAGDGDGFLHTAVHGVNAGVFKNQGCLRHKNSSFLKCRRTGPRLSVCRCLTDTGNNRYQCNRANFMP